MKTTKSAFTYIMILVIFSVTNLNCTKEKAEIIQPYTPDLFETAGRIHNEGLDYILDGFKEVFQEKAPTLFSKEEIIEIAQRLGKEFLEQSNEEGVDTDFAIESYDDFANITTQLALDSTIAAINFPDRFLDAICNCTFPPCINIPICPEDDPIWRYWEMISKNLESNLSSSNTVLDFDKINKQAESEISEDSILQIVYIGTSIAEYSLMYWENNSNEWFKTFGGDPNDLVLLSNAKKLVKADVAGGIVGGAAGALGGPPGAMGGALAGSISSSTVSAVKSVLDLIF